MIDTLRQDLRYAVRSLARRPGFSLGAMAILALGLGAVTAGFSVANWLLLRPVPGVRDDGRLATVWMGRWNENGGVSPEPVSDRDFAELAPQLTAFSALAGYQPGFLALATAFASARRGDAQFVTADYATVLGATPQLGRWFAPDENLPPEGTAVAVISDRLWRGMFNGNPAVLGSPMQVNGRVVQVIGVMRPDFHGAERDAENDVWLPGNAEFAVRHLNRPPDKSEAGIERFYQFVGRLQAGATFAQAQSQLQGAGRRWAQLHPDDEAGLKPAEFKLFPRIGVFAIKRNGVVATTRLLVGVASLLLLLACANVANLLLFRSITARGELAVRRALGASFGRLARQQICGAVLLSLGGGAAGTLLALWILDLFRSLRTGLIDASHVTLDWRVIVFALSAAVVTGVLAGLAPTFATRADDLMLTMKGAGPTDTGRRAPLRHALAVAQVSICLVLLVGALLFTRTLQHLAAVDLGLETHGVTTFTVNPREEGYTAESARTYWAEFTRRLAAAPGIEGVSVAAFGAPFGGSSFRTGVRAAENATVTPVNAIMNQVTPTYFGTLGIPIVRGTVWTAADSAQAVIVLTQSLARRLFGDRDPIGRLVELPPEPGAQRVVGIAADNRWMSLEGEPEPSVFRPYREVRLTGTMLVRSSLPPAQVDALAEHIAADLDPSVPIYGFRTLDDRIAATLSERRLFARVLGLLALFGVVLAAAGLYALIGFGVAARTRELGIRTALGATPAAILSMVLREGVALTCTGLAVGLIGAIFATRIVSSRLFGITALDPVTYLSAVLVLVGVAFLASLVPARAATKVDPMTALRAE